MRLRGGVCGARCCGLENSHYNFCGLELASALLAPTMPTIRPMVLALKEVARHHLTEGTPATRAGHFLCADSRLARAHRVSYVPSREEASRSARQTQPSTHACTPSISGGISTRRTVVRRVRIDRPLPLFKVCDPALQFCDLLLYRHFAIGRHQSFSTGGTTLATVLTCLT